MIKLEWRLQLFNFEGSLANFGADQNLFFLAFLKFADLCWPWLTSNVTFLKGIRQELHFEVYIEYFCLRWAVVRHLDVLLSMCLACLKTFFTLWALIIFTVLLCLLFVKPVKSPINGVLSPDKKNENLTFFDLVPKFMNLTDPECALIIFWKADGYLMRHFDK